jgi:pimeloyl-ACP methyl ester carboxylesterase
MIKKRWWILGVAVAVPLGVVGHWGPPLSPGEADAAHDHVERRSYQIPESGLKVSYLRKGERSGRRVIFVHGTPGDALEWEGYLATVPHGVEMLAVDRLGFGASEPDKAVTSLAEQAAALKPLLINQGGGWPILVGHSLGGPVVGQLAADNPGKVGGLLILAGSFDPGQEHIYAIQYAGEWSAIRSILPNSLRNANRELIALKGELETLAPRLAGIRCHVAVIHGTSDSQVPYANVAFQRSHLTNARLTVETIPGQNHFLPQNEAARIGRTLTDLLREVPKPC